jgi:hypothetical protein
LSWFVKILKGRFHGLLFEREKGLARLLYNAYVLGDATNKTTRDDNSGAIGIFTINILAGLCIEPREQGGGSVER